MYQLICEGRCNPTIAEADRIARKYMQDKLHDRFADEDALLAAQRALVYTIHTYEANIASCDVCGHERGFGDRIHRYLAVKV